MVLVTVPSTTSTTGARRNKDADDHKTAEDSKSNINRRAGVTDAVSAKATIVATLTIAALPVIPTTISFFINATKADENKKNYQSLRHLSSLLKLGFVGVLSTEAYQTMT